MVSNYFFIAFSNYCYLCMLLVFVSLIHNHFILFKFTQISHRALPLHTIIQHP